MNRSNEPRKILTLASQREKRERSYNTDGLSVVTTSPDHEIHLNEIGEWVNEGGAGGEVRRQ